VGLLSGLALAGYTRLLQSQVEHLAGRVESMRRLGVPAATAGPASAHDKLRAFENYLLPQAEIPRSLEDLISLAEAEGLLLASGEYKPQLEWPGGFLRYRMLLPVNGDAAAVQRFVVASIQRHPTLALESIAFKRGAVESAQVQARVQFVLLTRGGARIDTQAVADGDRSRQ
jgi:hypothetical protein